MYGLLCQYCTIHTYPVHETVLERDGRAFMPCLSAHIPLQVRVTLVNCVQKCAILLLYVLQVRTGELQNLGRSEQLERAFFRFCRSSGWFKLNVFLVFAVSIAVPQKFPCHTKGFSFLPLLKIIQQLTHYLLIYAMKIDGPVFYGDNR